LLVFQFVAAAVRRGEHAALFAFDEELGLLFSRSKALGIDLERVRDDGNLVVFQIDAAEAFGEVRRANSVLKKRTGSHERTIREYEITSKGLTVGPVAPGLSGCPGGLPQYRRPAIDNKSDQ
jgi:hypothetical protein